MTGMKAIHDLVEWVAGWGWPAGHDYFDLKDARIWTRILPDGRVAYVAYLRVKP